MPCLSYPRLCYLQTEGHFDKHAVVNGKALRNYIRIIFEEMSSWTSLTMNLGMKTTFYTKYIKANMPGFL